MQSELRFGVSNIDRVWTWEQLKLRHQDGTEVNSKNPLRNEGRFECSVQLDFKGDGTDMYPKAPKVYSKSFSYSYGARALIKSILRISD